MQQRVTGKIKVALIISTYNWPEALELVLKSITAQTRLPDEVIIADDGSSVETRRVIEAARKMCNCPIQHIWHEDRGFRKSTMLNKAMAVTRSEYIILIDGDCIIHRNFVADHIRNADINTYLFGCRVNIKKPMVKTIIQQKKTVFSCFSGGLGNRTRAIYFPLLNSKSQKVNSLSGKLRGCNMSFWRQNAIDCNGFNESITGWGREDSEFIVRMSNNGISGLRLKFCAIVYHLYHNKRSRDSVTKNTLIQQEAIDKTKKWCANGIEQYLVNQTIE